MPESATGSTPEYRRDPVTGHRVIIAERRAARPNPLDKVERNAGEETPATGQPTHDPTCPFCVGNESMTPATLQATPEAPAPWRVRAVSNLYPAVISIDDPIEISPSDDLPESADSDDRDVTPRGVHEVLVETRDHRFCLSQIDDSQMELVCRLYRDRLAAASRVPRLRAALLFKNVGRDAGASLAHAHSQLIGLTHVPPRINREVRRSDSYYRRHRRCLFCRLIEQARRGGRIIWEDCDVAVLTPPAPRVAFETWLLPVCHAARFELASDHVLRHFAIYLRRLVVALRQLQPRLHYNQYIHSAPFDRKCDDNYHWHMELLPRLHRLAGWEFGTDVHVVPVSPERAADELRQAVTSW